MTGMAPLPDLIRSAGLTRVTIIKNCGTDDEERVEVEAQLLNSKEAYFAIEDPRAIVKTCGSACHAA